MSVLVHPPGKCYDERCWPASEKPKQELIRFLVEATLDRILERATPLEGRRGHAGSASGQRGESGLNEAS
jgi:hypothetical protein